MNLTAEILKEHSKKQCTTITQWVGNSQQRFDELFTIFLQGEKAGKTKSPLARKLLCTGVSCFYGK